MFQGIQTSPGDSPSDYYLSDSPALGVEYTLSKFIVPARAASDRGEAHLSYLIALYMD